MFILHLWEERKEMNKETNYKLLPLSVFGCQIKQIQSGQFMVTFTSQLAAFASGIFIVASCPSEIPGVDWSLWSFCDSWPVRDWLYRPWRNLQVGPSWVEVIIWHFLQHLIEEKNKIHNNEGCVICAIMHQGKWTDLSLHLLRKTPLLSGYSLLQGPLSVHEDTPWNIAAPLKYKVNLKPPKCYWIQR